MRNRTRLSCRISASTPSDQVRPAAASEPSGSDPDSTTDSSNHPERRESLVREAKPDKNARRVFTALRLRLARLRPGLANLRALWRDFTGESAYGKYVERHRREHPDHAPMTEREFWRARARFKEDNISTGCC